MKWAVKSIVKRMSLINPTSKCRSQNVEDLKNLQIDKILNSSDLSDFSETITNFQWISLLSGVYSCNTDQNPELKNLSNTMLAKVKHLGSNLHLHTYFKQTTQCVKS